VGQIPYCTIHAFKGLEAPAIVLTDIEAVEGPAMENLFYVAVTRATDRLIVLASVHSRGAIAQALDRPQNEKRIVTFA
jgi:superfamily I DNA/RNA helicase